MGGRPYQLDGLLNGDVMVESKDYTIDDRKVGRPDLQKLQGALSDLPQIKEGIFTSATEFSRDAIKYAKGTEVNDEQKTITTVDIRPSTPEDEEGRVKTIVVQMQYMVPNFDRGEKSILFTDAGKKQIIDYIKAHGMAQYQLCVSMFYNENGEPLISMSDLSRQNQPHSILARISLAVNSPLMHISSSMIYWSRSKVSHIVMYPLKKARMSLPSKRMAMQLS